MNKIIISDTSCLIALERIGQLDILRRTFKVIIITQEVYQEFGNRLPDWIIIKEVKNKEKQKQLESFLDNGEASSIALATEIKNALLIIDERKGREIAKTFNLEIIGTLGLLIKAKEKGVISNLKDIVIELIKSGFRVSDSIVNEILKDKD
ncbi:MAG: DUF3368 domain-containing protein [Bacteroidetes bacterium]|nr:DUF3368 domain-containing protein [Bacteroidota bacterium]MBL7105647.1 DUF3368 domain-containing protein [Bacteroidales bacterium]